MVVKGYSRISPKQKLKEKKTKTTVFKGCGLSITIQCELQTVDFLHVISKANKYINHSEKKVRNMCVNNI